MRPTGRPQYSKPFVLEPRQHTPIQPVADNQLDANNFYWHLLKKFAEKRNRDFAQVKQEFVVHILAHESPIFRNFFDTQAQGHTHALFSTEWLENEADLKLAQHILYVVCSKKVIFDPDEHALGVLAMSSYMKIDVKYFAFNWEATHSTAPRSAHPNSTSVLYSRDCIQYIYADTGDSQYAWFEYGDGGNVHKHITCECGTQHIVDIVEPSDINLHDLLKSRWTVTFDNRPAANFTPWKATRTPPGRNPSRTATLFLLSMAKTHELHLWHDLNDDHGVIYKNVYQAFKRLLGMMLHDCQDFLVKGPRFSKLPSWMQQFALADAVHKQQWRNVLDESIASWHAVVLRFFEICAKFDNTQICQGKYTIHARDEPRQKFHYVHNLKVQVQTNAPTDEDVQPHPVYVSRAWPTYSKSMFVKNTQNFVVQFQKLVMKRHNEGQNMSASVFGFWFTLDDLQQWIRDIHEILQNPELRPAYPRRFQWPKCCRKGEQLEENTSRSYAYKDFCRQMKLSFNDKKSQQQFLIRMRAAWLRLVACYPYTYNLVTGAPAIATDTQIAQYLEDQNIREVNVREPETRVADSHLANILSADPNQLRNRRVLVPGTHMTNPYLCTPL